MDGGDDHGVVGETVTRLKPLRLVHAERESVGFLSSRAQTRQQLNTLGSTDKYETYLIVERLGVPDPVSPDSRSSRITSEEDRLVRLDTGDHGLFEGRGGCVDVYNRGALCFNKKKSLAISDRKFGWRINSHRTDIPPETLPSLSTVYNFSYSFLGSLINEKHSFGL
jgi:hypothetical protein